MELSERHVRAALVAWFRRHAAERLPERVAAWRAKAGVGMPHVVIADQQKRWGSCDRNGTIRLNWRIIQAPMRLVDYVVVHELVHLRHPGHGREYWQAVGRVLPDYERAAKTCANAVSAWRGKPVGSRSALPRRRFSASFTNVHNSTILSAEPHPRNQILSYQ